MRSEKINICCAHSEKKLMVKSRARKELFDELNFCGVLALEKLKTMDSIDNFAIFNFKWKLWTVISHFMEWNLYTNIHVYAQRNIWWCSWWHFTQLAFQHYNFDYKTFYHCILCVCVLIHNLFVWCIQYYSAFALNSIQLKTTAILNWYSSGKWINFIEKYIEVLTPKNYDFHWMKKKEKNFVLWFLKMARLLTGDNTFRIINETIGNK